MIRLKIINMLKTQKFNEKRDRIYTYIPGDSKRRVHNLCVCVCSLEASKVITKEENSIHTAYVYVYIPLI